jgi:hypothetical protein
MDKVLDETAWAMEQLNNFIAIEEAKEKRASRAEYWREYRRKNRELVQKILDRYSQADSPYVYVIRDNSNTPIYIGNSVLSPKRRALSYLKANNNSRFSRYLREQGIITLKDFMSNFKFDVITGAETKQEARQIERSLIMFAKSLPKPIIFNQRS